MVRHGDKGLSPLDFRAPPPQPSPVKRGGQKPAAHCSPSQLPCGDGNPSKKRNQPWHPDHLMARIPDAFIDDRAAMAIVCEAPQRAAARRLNPLAGLKGV